MTTTVHTPLQPAIPGTAYEFYTKLTSQSDTNIFQTSVTLAVGDVKVSIDDGAESNIATLPTEVGTSGKLVINLSAAETTGATKFINVSFRDVSGSEWQDQFWSIPVMATRTVSSFDEDNDVVQTVYTVQSVSLAPSAIAQLVSGSAFPIWRGDDLDQSVTNLGSLIGYTTIDFTVKEDKDDTDANAIIRIRKNATGLNDGLLVFNKAAAATAANGSIAIDNSTSGNITVSLVSARTAELQWADGYYYDIQVINSTGKVTTKSDGVCNIGKDVTRAVS